MIRKGEYYEHPAEIWSAEECAKKAKRIEKDAYGTKRPAGYIVGPQLGWGKTRYNGGCIRGDDWYEGEIFHLPTIAEGFKLVRSMGGWRIEHE